MGLWELMDGKMRFSVGNGRTVRFCLDKWCDDEPLRVSFPSLFETALPRDAWVVDVWSSSNGGCWAPWFERRMNN